MTPNQKKQEAWLIQMENREIAGQIGLANLPDYFLSCRTCKNGQTHHNATQCLAWLGEHDDHNTWIDYGGARRRG